VTVATVSPLVRAQRVSRVVDAKGARRFEQAGRAPYVRDRQWTPAFPGEERDAFAAAHDPARAPGASARWVLEARGAPIGRVAAFAPRHRPGVGYVGFFESPDSTDAARRLLETAEAWLAGHGRRAVFGPIAVTPRDRIGMLVEGFDRPAMLFTPYNPPYYPALFEAAGYTPHRRLRAYAWEPGVADLRATAALAERRAARSNVRIRPIRLASLRDETRILARLVNATLADAWHFDPIGDREADDLARLLRPLLDPSLALVAEDDAGPCGVALAVPDANWLWRQAGGRLWPAGWLQLLRWRRRIPQVRLMAFGLEPRVRGTAVAVRLMDALTRSAREGGYARAELSQVYEDNTRMRRTLDRMGFPIVRRYAVFARQLEA
jgi:GNAT superfamily N-acetyltransferase